MQNSRNIADDDWLTENHSTKNVADRSIWSFRRKHAPDWTIINHKARLCPHGGKQVEGEHFWATYAPVVHWPTVRLVLILSLLANLKSRQIDDVNAFTQAPADCDIFMSIPAGFAVSDNTLQFIGSSSSHNNSDYVLHIKKNMYGLHQAGNNWFDALCSALINLGFCQSSHDPCLFNRKDCLLLVYVDDCLLFGKTTPLLPVYRKTLSLLLRAPLVPILASTFAGLLMVFSNLYSRGSLTKSLLLVVYKTNLPSIILPLT